MVKYGVDIEGDIEILEKEEIEEGDCSNDLSVRKPVDGDSQVTTGGIHQEGSTIEEDQDNILAVGKKENISIQPPPSLHLKKIQYKKKINH